MSRRNPFLNTGLPIVAFCVIAAYGLGKLNQGRFDTREREQKHLLAADTEQKKEVFDLEKEYEKMMKEIDLDKWEPKKIQR
jgi:hypothetical protein